MALGQDLQAHSFVVMVLGRRKKTEPKKEEEMGAPVVHRQSHAQASPRLEKTGTSISTQGTTQAGTFRRVWGPKEGKEKHLQR